MTVTLRHIILHDMANPQWADHTEELIHTRHGLNLFGNVADRTVGRTQSIKMIPWIIKLQNSVYAEAVRPDSIHSCSKEYLLTSC